MNEHRREVVRASWQRHKEVYLFAKKMQITIPMARQILTALDKKHKQENQHNGKRIKDRKPRKD